jgi:UDP-glucose 4-epimerase
MYFAEAYARFFGAPQLHNSIPPSLHNSITPSLHHSNTPTGFRATALRYFCVYGPRQDYRRTIPPLFSAIIIRLLRGEQPTIYGTGEKRRDFIHVDDINDFHIKCMTDERTTGNVYNLGSGINFSVNEIYEIIGRLLKTDKEPLYKPDLPGEAFANLADISAAKNLGWSPKISLEDGLKSSIDFLRKEIERGNVA